MCGRFTLAISATELATYIVHRYQISSQLPRVQLPQFNIAPSNQVISIIHDGKNYRIGTLKWGFEHANASSEIPFTMINAKAETLWTKTMFKTAVLKQRCVILADSFYEWDKVDKTKKPKRIYTTDQKIFPMAGIWTTTVKPDGQKEHTVAIVTTAANALVATLHDRMPVILNEKDEQVWLNPMISDETILQKVLHPYDASIMGMYSVSKKVGSPAFNSEDAIKEEEDEQTLI